MRTQQTQKTHLLTGIDVEYLKLVKTLHFVNCDLLITLRGLSINSKPKVQTRLKTLFEAGFLERRSLPDITPGNPEYIYALSTRSIRILEEMGYTGFSRFRPDDFRSYSYPFLNHCIELNRLLACAYTVERFIPSMQLVSLLHDIDLHRTPIRVTVDRRVPGGGRVEEKTVIIPDALLDFRMSIEGQEKRKRRIINVELDRATVTNPAQFKKKIRAFVPYVLSEDYKALTGTNSGIIAFATTTGQSRLKQMIEWTEQELTQQQLERENNLYRFACLPDGAYIPQEIFCTPIWYKPFDASPTSLLWQV